MPPADLSVPSEPIPSDERSDAATEEARLLQEGDLERQARKHRSSRMWHLHLIGTLGLWALVGTGVIIGGMGLFHLVTPPACHLLEADQLSRLNTIIVTSIVSALLTFFVQEMTR